MSSREMQTERLTLHLMDVAQHQDTFAQDVAYGLAAPRKTLSARYFYDDLGSQLYEQICNLPEYYPYRAEREIFMLHAAEMYAEIGHLALVELGPGNASKTRYLLMAYEQAGRPFLYCPVDISRTALETASHQLLATYPHLTIQAMHADFVAHPEVIRTFHLEQQAVAFFGSNLGNLTTQESVILLRSIAELMGPEDVFLLGIDLKKSTTILLPAYDDAQGVTAAFNLNVLRRINRELGANFDLRGFTHVALYNEAYGRIEMHLRSRWPQHVTIAKTAQTVAFAADETIHTENSYKYSVADVRDLGHHANLTLHRTWFDQKHYFLVALFRRRPA